MSEKRFWNEESAVQTTIDIVQEQRIISLTKRYRPGQGDLTVFLNGLVARADIDYRELDGYTLEFYDDLKPGDVIICRYLKLW